MPSKKETKKRVPKVEWQGYLTVNLSAEDDVIYDSWAIDKNIGLSDINELVENGYKFSLGWDDYNDAPVASLYANSTKLEWAGWVLTGWAGNYEDAIKLLFFKHYELCEENWNAFKGKASRSGAKRG